MIFLSRLNLILPLVTISLFSAACSESGSGDGDSDKTVDLGISAVANADLGSSYENSKSSLHIDYAVLPLQGAVLRDAIAYLEADGNPGVDVFMGTGEFLLEGEIDSQLFLNDGSDNFVFDNNPFNGDVPQATHARKSIVADFDGNSLDDIVILDHGFDSNPFPGSNPKLIMQDSAASFSWRKLTDQTGFHHGGAAADIDNDGDIDIFVAGFEPFFFVNDGAGNFTKVDDRFDGSINKVFTTELIDVDEDGFVDLLVGAHEQDGDDATIYWGSTKGSYSKSLSTILPSLDRYGTVLDFEVENFDSDDNRDIAINRTGGGDNNFYIGSKVQVLISDGNRGFTDASAQVDNSGTDADAWFPWLRAQDIDGDLDIDIFTDNKGNNIIYRNDGAGNFTRGTF